MYGFSIALMKGVSLIMLPIFAYYLTEDDFGRLEIITSLAVIGSILVGMGLEATLFRFVSKTDDPTEQKRIAASNALPGYIWPACKPAGRDHPPVPRPVRRLRRARAAGPGVPPGLQ